jgi:hypothetical protein
MNLPHALHFRVSALGRRKHLQRETGAGSARLGLSVLLKDGRQRGLALKPAALLMRVTEQSQNVVPSHSGQANSSIKLTGTFSVPAGSSDP